MVYWNLQYEHTHIVIRQPALVAGCASAKLKGVININLKILKSTFGKVGGGEPQNKLMCLFFITFLIRGQLSYERSE